MRQIRSHSTSTSSSRAKRSLASFASASMAASLPASRWRWSRSTVAVSTTEVTIPGFVTQLPIVQTAPSPVRAAIPRISSASLAAAASASRRRSIGVEPACAAWPRKRDLVALDAERAEHDAEREIHALQHRALLDVELEVGGRVRELRVGVERAVEVDAVLGQGVLPADPGGVGALPELGLVGHGPARRRSSRTASGRSARPPRRPSSTSRTVTGGVPSSAIRRRTSTPATTLREPSSQPPFGTESMWPPISERPFRGPAQREPLVPGLVDLLLGAGRRDLAGEPALRRHPRVRPGHSLGAVLVPGQLPELAELVHGAARFQRHGGNV